MERRLMAAAASGGGLSLIQRMAMQSWTELRPRPLVLLLGAGQEEGLQDVARLPGVVARAEPVEKGADGSPLLSSVLQLAYRAAPPEARVFALVDADVLLLSDFLEALRVASDLFPSFLLAGQRTDLAAPWPGAPGAPPDGPRIKVNFTDACWEARLQEEVAGARVPGGAAELAGRWAQGYLAFTRDAFDPEAVPPLALGRPRSRSWMLHAALARGVPLVDSTDAVLALRQSPPASLAPPSALPSGGQQPSAAEWAEAEREAALCGACLEDGNLEHATHHFEVAPPGGGGGGRPALQILEGPRPAPGPPSQEAEEAAAAPHAPPDPDAGPWSAMGA
eukprot:tig00001310_g8157.t1